MFDSFWRVGAAWFLSETVLVPSGYCWFRRLLVLLGFASLGSLCLLRFPSIRRVLSLNRLHISIVQRQSKEDRRQGCPSVEKKPDASQFSCLYSEAAPHDAKADVLPDVLPLDCCLLTSRNGFDYFHCCAKVRKGSKAKNDSQPTSEQRRPKARVPFGGVDARSLPVSCLT